MILALVCGAGVGAGIWMVARGWAPPRPSLADTLAHLRIPTPIVSTVEPDEASGYTARLGQPLARALVHMGGESLIWPQVRRDLAVLDRSVERHLAEKATLALVGLLLPPACTGLLTFAGLQLPVALPLWGAVVIGATFFVLPDFGIHSEAEGRRRDFRHALGSFLDLVVISLAGGGGVETALSDGAGIGDGWAFDQIRQALNAARLARETPWSALERLGERLGIGELGELAASVGLAGAEGAKVRASLAAKAASLRSHQLAEAETVAQATTERMSLPVVVLFAGFLCFIGYPAIERVLTGL